uniref:G-protein coupled receptors family 1 profile domain-containing protein n=1 Tax=Pyxicephalus adspersus TaxID=30357 RepID=A0AAV3AQG2_PYXAD|nr:TPA: hypothetical protein GDO54_005824 [Pyxicephalus adspersus]
MDENNITRITVIHLVGCATQPKIEYLVFFLLIIVYFMTVCGHLLIITLVSYSKSFHSPMYFFLTQLSLSDIVIVTDILPNMLNAVLVKEIIIPFSLCLTQLYIFSVSEVLQCLLLTVMSYDRYLAICKPLHYSSIMSHHACWIVIIIFWTLSIFIELIKPLNISKLQFCDTSNIELEVTLLGGFIVVIPFFIIIVSYVYIIVTVFNIKSITSRQKAFSTCSSHLAVVSIFYVTITFVTPLLNPVIYSLRNKDLKQVVGKLINTIQHLPSNN